MTALIVLFLREHNRRAAELEESGIHDDELLFQLARQHVVGLIQKFTYEEYLPMLLGDSLPEYTGYNASVDPRMDNAFAAAAFRYGHYTLNGLVKLMDANGDIPASGHILMRDSFFNNSIFHTEHGFDHVLRGVAFVAESDVDLRMCDDFRNEFYTAGTYPARFDLGAVDIARGRDAGVPRYSALRACYGLGREDDDWDDWDAAFGPTQGRRLAGVYASPRDVDALVGMLAEPDGGGGQRFLPPLLRRVILDQFRRLRDGDRFFYLRYPERRRIQGTTLSATIRRNSNITCLPANVFQTSPLSACFGGAGSMAASVVLEYDHGLTLLPGALKLYWSLLHGDTLSVLLLGKTTGFMALGFGSDRMRGTDVIFGSVAEDGTARCTDATLGTDRAAPTADAVSDIVEGSVAGFQSNGITGLRFQRRLDTGDPSDFVIPAVGPVPIIFSVGSRDTLQYHGFSSRGAGTVDFGTGMGSATAGEDPRVLNVRYFHGLVMAGSWLVLYPVGVIIARYFKHKRHWSSLHITANASGSVGAAGMAFMALLTARDGSFPQHGMQGLGMCACLLVMLVLGWYSRWGIRKQQYHTIRLVHRVTGRCMVLFAPYQCWLGVQTLFPGGGPHKTTCECIIVAVSAVMVAVALSLELRRRWQARAAPKAVQQSHRRTNEETRRALPAFTWTEIQARTAVGASWIVIDNLIYDVHRWLNDHPGGKTVLLQRIGTDATREFLGEQPFADAPWARGSAPRPDFAEAVANLAFSAGHPHSKKAVQQLETLAIGRLLLELPARADPPPSLPRLDSTDFAAKTPPCLPPRLEPPCPPLTPQSFVRTSTSSMRCRDDTAGLHVTGLSDAPPAAGLRARVLSKVKFSRRRGATEGAVPGSSEGGVERRVGAGGEGVRGGGEALGPDALRRGVLLSRRRVNGSAESPVVELVLGLQAGDRMSFRPGESIQVQAVIHSQVVVRSYTPVTWDTSGSGTLRLLVKLATRPVLGVMSDYLHHHLQLGGQLRFVGPRGSVCLDSRSASGCFPRVAFVCAGSGVTDALLLLDYYRGQGASSRVSVLYSAKTRGDFVSHEELLGEHAAASNGRVRVRYTVTDKTQELGGWTDFVGRVDARMLSEVLRDTAKSAPAGTYGGYSPAGLPEGGEGEGRLHKWVREEVRWVKQEVRRLRVLGSLSQAQLHRTVSSDYEGDLEGESGDDPEGTDVAERRSEHDGDQTTRLHPRPAALDADDAADELQIFICGPVKFEQFVRRLCVGLGHADDRIHCSRG